MFGYIVESMDFRIFNLEKFGVGNIIFIKGIKLVELFLFYVIKICEKLLGKDMMIGYWEIMGLYVIILF